MKRETTPARITDKILELCNQVVPGREPEYVPVEVQSGSLPNECFPNVERMVSEYGGRQVNGRSIWQWANILVEAEAHAVWENPEGKLIDITPHDNGEAEILFLRDETMVYAGRSIGNIKLALTDSPLVAELLDLTKKTENIMCEYEPGTEITVIELRQRLGPMAIRQKMIMEKLYQRVGRNDPCPCQSGLKYKRCCGRDE